MGRPKCLPSPIGRGAGGEGGTPRTQKPIPTPPPALFAAPNNATPTAPSPQSRSAAEFPVRARSRSYRLGSSCFPMGRKSQTARCRSRCPPWVTNIDASSVSSNPSPRSESTGLNQGEPVESHVARETGVAGSSGHARESAGKPSHQDSRRTVSHREHKRESCDLSTGIEARCSSQSGSSMPR